MVLAVARLIHQFVINYPHRLNFARCKCRSTRVRDMCLESGLNGILRGDANTTGVQDMTAGQSRCVSCCLRPGPGGHRYQRKARRGWPHDACWAGVAVLRRWMVTSYEEDFQNEAARSRARRKEGIVGLHYRGCRSGQDGCRL